MFGIERRKNSRSRWERQPGRRADGRALDLLFDFRSRQRPYDTFRTIHRS